MRYKLRGPKVGIAHCRSPRGWVVVGEGSSSAPAFASPRNDLFSASAFSFAQNNDKAWIQPLIGPAKAGLIADHLRYRDPFHQRAPTAAPSHHHHRRRRGPPHRSTFPPSLVASSNPSATGHAKTQLKLMISRQTITSPTGVAALHIRQVHRTAPRDQPAAAAAGCEERTPADA